VSAVKVVLVRPGDSAVDVRVDVRIAGSADQSDGKRFVAAQRRCVAATKRRVMSARTCTAKSRYRGRLEVEDRVQKGEEVTVQIVPLPVSSGVAILEQGQSVHCRFATAPANPPDSPNFFPTPLLPTIAGR
jgi:hypothetical protein